MIAEASLFFPTGPIIRVTPDEIKIKDIEYYDSLYSISQPRDKYGPSAKMAGTPLSGTHPPIKHRCTPIRSHTQTEGEPRRMQGKLTHTLTR